ncbi:MAG: hypothetical protein GY737_20680 [Desulfobacteraceae bacterium]|nr:hypothetical protein [Desulfobacteraceae bacterium]
MKEQSDTIARTMGLITDMVMELHFRGCDDTHPLIMRAGELVPRLKAMADHDPENRKPAADAPKTPAKLYLMTAEEVSKINLEEDLTKGLIPGEDLSEAAFIFENELMGLLGDDNAMSMDAYSGMDEQTLIGVIRSAVENICRLRLS